MTASAPSVLAAPDKFRGTLSAPTAAASIAAGAEAAGWLALEHPMADGGEGTLEVLGGANQFSSVAGPFGGSVVAGWRLDGGVAVIEAATASGLDLVGGADTNDPVQATSGGVGELIIAAAARGASEIVVAVGGSATTDGGVGAVAALSGTPFAELGVTVRVACDVTTCFLDAAAVFGPQKGATPAQIEFLTERLGAAARRYEERFGRDVTNLPGSGAAGGLAGGLAALGAVLEGGFDLVASLTGLDDDLAQVDAVVTGEGCFDHSSLRGKVVGGVLDRCLHLGHPVLAVVGCRQTRNVPGLDVIALTDVFGAGTSWCDPAAGVATTTKAWLEAQSRQTARTAAQGRGQRAAPLRTWPVDCVSERLPRCPGPRQ